MAKVKCTTHTAQVRLLVDSGSELSLISEACFRRLQLTRRRSAIEILGVSGHKAAKTRGVASVTLHSNYRLLSLTVQAHILPSVSCLLPSFNITNTPEWAHLNKLKLADPDFLVPREVDLLLGADVYGQLIRPNIIRPSAHLPMAQLSIFGWLVLGPVNSTSSVVCNTHLGITMSTTQSLDNLIAKFWLQEEPPRDNNSLLTPDEEECEAHFRRTHSRDASGRYTVRIPLKTAPSALGDSLQTARRSLTRILRRLDKDNQYKELYTCFMQEYRDLGHMVKVTDHSYINRSRTGRAAPIGKTTLAHDDPSSGGLGVSSGWSATPSLRETHPYYLPHHGVLRPDSSTTKLRVVFNGSSASTSGASINDLMHTGQNLTLNIFDLLLWIRQYKHLFASDITKMYRQIKVHQDDWDLQRILWIDENAKECSYWLTTVTYGTKAAPFLAVRTLLQLAEDEGKNYPLAVDSIKHGRYVDDIFGGADSGEQLLEIARQLCQLCKAGGFPLAKWHSTSTDLLKTVSPDCRTNAEISFDDCKTKILGIRWLPIKDTLEFSSISVAHSSKPTKRLVLSEVAQIYDPLGLTAPVVIRAKMFIQELWLHKLDWDSPLPDTLTAQWLSIRKDLFSLAKLSIPRWFNTYSNSQVELHGFADASQLAMAAVVYLTVHSPSTGPEISLVCSKTKVAPLKRLTIPRLELCAALLLSALVNHVHATLHMDISNTYLWTNSQVPLTWIKTHPSKWKDYVRNRVIKIQENSEHFHWKHVPGTSNPADCASRGLTTDQLEHHSLWWRGPPWLAQSRDHWPAQNYEVQDDLTAQEIRPHVTLHVKNSPPQYSWDLIYRCSSLKKLLKTTALWTRLIKKLSKKHGPIRPASVTATDLEDARRFWIKATQIAFFPEELKTLKKGFTLPSSHPFNRLTAFIDQHGIIRVGGRLERSALTYENKHPAILPRSCQFSDLAIAHAHENTLHGGTQDTLAYLRLLYWVIGGRAPVKTHILRCVVCARHRGVRAQQLMGQLPHARVTPSRAFTHTGIDYAGPLTLKTWKGRGTKTAKGWICVFVCLTTSAVHLDVVSDCSTEGFMATYRRFTARRGIPSNIYSDCGTNFAGAENQLKKCFKEGTQEAQRLSLFTAQQNTQWHFNPPAAPHMGGKWEAAVKSLKFHLRRTLKDTPLTFEETSTLLTQIESILNSRPLGSLSEEPEDVLTPGHFLIGTALNAVPEAALLDVSTSRLTRWQFLQQRVQQFWRLWSTQYLQRLQSISRWYHPNNSIKTNSIVLITDERLPPGKWPLARVIELHPGKDGLTRVVTLKTATTTLTRPIAKLALLPVTAADDHSATHPDNSENCSANTVADGGRNVEELAF